MPELTNISDIESARKRSRFFDDHLKYGLDTPPYLCYIIQVMGCNYTFAKLINNVYCVVNIV